MAKNEVGEKSEMLDRIGRHRHEIRHHDADCERQAGGENRQQQRKEDHEHAAEQTHEKPLCANQSVIAIARNAMRSRTDNFSVSLLSCPQAARMSRPRGVRTGEA